MALQREGIDIEDLWKAIEACYENNWTDGLPVVPPTEPLVTGMLAAGPWAEDDVLLFEPARNLSVTAYKAAINAVMAAPSLHRPRSHPALSRLRGCRDVDCIRGDALFTMRAVRL